MKKNKSGFTIVEMLLYMSLLTIFIGIMVSIFVSIMKSQVNTFKVTSNEYDSRFIISRLSYDLTNAESINVISDTEMTFVSNSISHTYTLSGSGTLLLDGIALNSPDTIIENLIFAEIDDTVQVKFTMNNKNFQSTYQIR